MRKSKLESANWSLSIPEIAKQTGMSYNSVYVYAKRHGIKTSKPQVKLKPPGRKSKIDWSLVDWSMPVSEISAKHGASKFTIYAHAKRNGIKAKAANRLGAPMKADKDNHRFSFGVNAELASFIENEASLAGITTSAWLRHAICQNSRLRTALKDAISTFAPDKDVLVTVERQEAWAKAFEL